MTAWTLEIAGRIVLRSEGGPAEAECALVHACDVVDGAPAVTYRTTAREALARLTAAGVTAALVDEATFALRAVAHRYARGDAVRQMLLELGPAELFDGYVFHAGGEFEERGYEGLVLDMRAIAGALGIAGAAATLQTFALASLLREVPEDAEVTFSEPPSPEARLTGDADKLEETE
ncbi:MAG TPA: hypothetical protein VNO21_01550, partial [Polyangiaceae bacterium]|nr:hypothetical protein [Polyangiaceae bacterium]